MSVIWAPYRQHGPTWGLIDPTHKPSRRRKSCKATSQNILPPSLASPAVQHASMLAATLTPTPGSKCLHFGMNSPLSFMRGRLVFCPKTTGIARPLAQREKESSRSRAGGAQSTGTPTVLACAPGRVDSERDGRPAESAICLLRQRSRVAPSFWLHFSSD